MFEPEISQIARNRAAGDMNARRRHMTGDYVPLAPDDVRTGDIPLDIPDSDGEWDEVEKSVTAALQLTVLELVALLKERFKAEQDSLVAEAHKVFHGDNDWMVDYMEVQVSDEENEEDE